MSITVALGTTAPAGSVTVPVSAPVLAVWAIRHRVIVNASNRTAIKSRNDCMQHPLRQTLFVGLRRLPTGAQSFHSCLPLSIGWDGIHSCGAPGRVRYDSAQSWFQTLSNLTGIFSQQAPGAV